MLFDGYEAASSPIDEFDSEVARHWHNATFESGWPGRGASEPPSAIAERNGDWNWYRPDNPEGKQLDSWAITANATTGGDMPAFSELDANADGQLTYEELVASGSNWDQQKFESGIRIATAP